MKPRSSFVEYVKSASLAESLCKMAAMTREEVELLQRVATGEAEATDVLDALFDRLPEMSPVEDRGLRAVLGALPQVTRFSAVLGWGLSRQCPQEDA